MAIGVFSAWIRSSLRDTALCTGPCCSDFVRIAFAARFLASRHGKRSPGRAVVTEFACFVFSVYSDFAGGNGLRF